MDKEFLSPPQIAEFTGDLGIKKAHAKALNLILLSFLAGVFIAFASEGSNMAAFNLLADANTYGLGKALAGAVFGTGLMLVLLAGGELFTGNTLMVISVLEKKITVLKMLRNWGIVYAGNFLGSLFIAYMMNESLLFNSGDNLLGGVTIKIAVYKISLPFMSAFYMGIMCNMLVCLAVWISYAEKSLTGKLLAVFFAIMLFITSGFEHCVANMYYIPAGIMAKSNELWAAASNLPADKLADLNWGAFFTKNLLPVSLGNIVGGAIFIGVFYWICYLRKEKK